MGSRYEVIRSIAKGGMADVFAARAQGADGYGKVVALKRIAESFANDVHAVEMLKDEARLVLQLNHPNIIQVFEIDRDDQGYFLVMELVDGHDLAQVLRDHRLRGQALPEACSVAIAISVLRALDYAHRLADQRGQPLGAVHRDVSPGNVLISKEGVVKLGDFGIAKARGRLQVTEAHQLKGKLRYMAPEQLAAAPVDGRTDVFAVGLVLWECLAGRRAYDMLDEVQLLRAALGAEVPRFERLGVPVPLPLADIVDQATAREPDRRFATAGEMANTLDRFHRRAHPDFEPGWLAALLTTDAAEVQLTTRPPRPVGTGATMTSQRPRPPPVEVAKTNPTVSLRGPASRQPDPKVPNPTRNADTMIAEVVAEEQAAPADAPTTPAKPLFK